MKFNFINFSKKKRCNMTTVNKLLHKIGKPLVYIVKDDGVGQLIGVFSDVNLAKHAMITINMKTEIDQTQWTDLVNLVFDDLSKKDKLLDWEFSLEMTFLNTINAHNVIDVNENMKDISNILYPAEKG